MDLIRFRTPAMLAGAAALAAVAVFPAVTTADEAAETPTEPAVTATTYPIGPGAATDAASSAHAALFARAPYVTVPPPPERAAALAGEKAEVMQRHLEAQQESVTAAGATAPEPVAAPAARRELWYSLAACESNGRWSYDGASGYDGGLQFHPRTWSRYAPSDFPAYAYQATPDQQIAVAEQVLDAQGWDAWPACARELGLR